MITAGQIKAARALAGWSQARLTREAGLSITTIKRMESPVGPDRSAAINVDSVRRALERAGIEFIPPNGGGPGVRLRDRGG